MHKLNLKSLITQIRGVSYQKGDAVSVCESGFIPLLRANNIQDGDLVESDLLFIPNKLVNEKQIIKKGDIIIAASSGSINIVGKAGFSKRDTNLTFGAFCKLIRPNTKKVLPEYLNYFFQSQEYRAKISSLAQGANINNLKNEHIDCLEVLIPPLPEQKRIATILDKADALRQKNKQLLAAYDELLQATFLDMFGDPVTNRKHFPIGKIEDLVSSVSYGTSSKSEEKGEFPYLRMNNITYSGEMDFSDLKYINLSEKDKVKYLVHKGDLLFNRTNSKDLVGKTAVYRDSRLMAIAGYIIRIRTNKKANTEFISGFLNSTHGKKTLKGLCKSIVGMANINAKELQRIKILIPPIELQNQFAEIVNNIEAQKALLKQSISESEDLFNGLVQKAFKGEL